VVVDPDDPDREERHRVGRVRRPLIPERVPQRPAAGLRDRGLAVEYALRNQPIRKQLELAAARGAPRAVIIGPDERKAKVAVVRDLKTGKQRKVALTKVRKGVFK